MKKLLLFCGSLLVVATLLFVSCQKDDEVNPTINKFFSVEDATLIKKNMPEPTVNDQIDVSMNASAIPGGTSIVRVFAEKVAEKILVGMKDQAGYYELVPSTRGEYSFLMQVNQDITLEDETKGFTVQVAIEDEDGGITQIWETTVKLIAVGTGDLQVSLSFDNAKDVDLHLIEPEYINADGEPVSFYSRHIYYGNNAAYYSGGILDLDSNAGCDIDNVNNENITYSEESGFVPAGTYKVYVDLFENCDPNIPTNYVVTVFYGGVRIANKAGVFDAGAPSTTNPIDEEYVAANDPFLTFTIAGNGQKCTNVGEGHAVLSEKAQEKEAIAVHK